jgi:4-amino-4-deoxy-L-arabinose transferase-like glycosyltransferase
MLIGDRISDFSQAVVMGVRRHPIVWLIAGIVALVHLLFAGRYDFFRNELYFIICGRHPAFGYVDQPPLVPLISAATQMFGNNLWLLRLPAVVSAVSVVLLAAAFTRLLGGGDFADSLAAVSSGVAPVLMALTNNLDTSTFEPLIWTAVAYLLTRAIGYEDRRALIWMGLVVGVGLESKYGILIWLIGLALAVLVTSSCRIIFYRELWIGIAIALAIALPNFIWQAVHNWPFLELVHNDSTSGRNLTGTPLEFVVNQVRLLNPVLAPLWLAGIVTPFVRSDLRKVQFLAIAFLSAIGIILFSHGKDYYLAGAYPTLFAIGAVACERMALWLRAVWIAAISASSLLFGPIMLPVLDLSDGAGHVRKPRWWAVSEHLTSCRTKMIGRSYCVAVCR